MSDDLAVAGITATTVDITIEPLSIEGFAPRDGIALRLALQQNLGRLIQEHGPPGGWATDTARTEVTATGPNWDGRGGDAGLGAALARQIYDAFAS